MATLYSHTFEDYTGVSALPGTYYLSELVTGGASHATVSSITVMFYKSSNGEYNMRCRIKDSDGNWGDYSYEDVTWAGETTQIITFTFADVTAQVSSDRFEVQVSKNSGPAYTTYTAHDDDDTYFVVEGTWEGVLPGQATDPTPDIDASDVTLHSTTGTWVSGGNTDSYNVYYGTLSGFLSLVGNTVELSMALVEGQFSVYGRISYWRVDAVNTAGITPGVEWAFTTMLFAPPLPTGVTLDEDGEPTGTPTGENNMLTVKRLVAAANGKIWVEDI